MTAPWPCTDHELRHPFEDHGAIVAVIWDKATERGRQLPAGVGLPSIVPVPLIPAMPLFQRLALRLPVPAAHHRRTPPGERLEDSV